MWTLSFSTDDCVATDITNKGTRQAWLYYWWNMAAEQDVPLTDLWEIWDEADPHDWYADDSNTIDQTRFPVARLQSAAQFVSPGYSTEHQDAEPEGVDH